MSSRGAYYLITLLRRIRKVGLLYSIDKVVNANSLEVFTGNVQAFLGGLYSSN